MNILKKLGKALMPNQLKPADFYNTYGSSERSRSRLPKSFNYAEATELCYIMKQYGSDKGLYQGIGKHNYTTFYFQLFKALKKEPVRLFELGLGTNNTTITANMGANGVPGASLRAWREFFEQGSIYGADIDTSILFSEDRIETFYCDQTKGEVIKEMWSNNAALNEPFDVIIDDGLHEFEANTCFFENSIENLKISGTYIIEDVVGSAVPKWKKIISESYTNKFPDLRFTVLEITNEHNKYDNNLVVIEKIN